MAVSVRPPQRQRRRRRRWHLHLVQAERLTQLVFPRVVGNLHDVELQALVALPNAVDAGDGGTGLVHRPHQLEEESQKRESK